MADKYVLYHEVDTGKVIKILAKDMGDGEHYRLGVDDAAAITIAHVDGLGTPGAPVGQVVTVQGDPAGIAVPVAPVPQTCILGISGTRFTSANASAAAVPVISAPGGVLKAVLVSLIITVGVAPLTVYFTEETTTTALFDVYTAALSTTIIPLSRLKMVTANKRLMVQTSGVGNIAVSAVWFAEA